MSTPTKTTIVYYSIPTYMLTADYKSAVNEYANKLITEGKSDGVLTRAGFGGVKRNWLDQESAENFITTISDLAIAHDVEIIKTTIVDYGTEDPDPPPLIDEI